MTTVSQLGDSNEEAGDAKMHALRRRHVARNTTIDWTLSIMMEDGDEEDKVEDGDDNDDRDDDDDEEE